MSEIERNSIILKQREKLMNSPWLEKVESLIPNIFVVLNKQREIIHSSNNLTGFGGIEDANRILGLRLGEALECRNVGELESRCGETVRCEMCGANRSIIGGLRGFAVENECRILTKNCDALDLKIWARPFIIDGEFFIFLVITDISSEKRRQSLERIFFHDVLNTAGNLLNISHLLKMGSIQDPEEYKAILYRLSRQIINEIEEFRDLSLAETQEIKVTPQSLEPLSFLKTLLEYYGQMNQSNRVAMVLDPETSVRRFSTDTTILQRIIGNLIKNALEASTEGESVSVGARENGSNVVFWVHNHQMMPPEVQMQVFQRSFSTKEKNRGLGTYSVKLLTEKYLKGEAGFISSEEKGTEFYISLPDLSGR